ncbi:MULTISPECIES: PTS glucitol/sorbitol transporter subunit IIC [Heyndrickxia]|jgi:PTS system glucitol/sorbitol-specific IIC component|uniref:PTS glucitol/sorbitol transporter subunit IIC n=1 Tax=Heyndrickxia TaxID=2837504 RepID=UPI0007794A97|nr:MULTISPECIES: PTS glucitol/sorbitol transporter subunit IIC [Heyndrickxia]KYC80666.1 PTS system, glucitol/sorbitol-specific IIC component [Heyndrickxia coagulans]MEC2224901.1 PTS glucitol/sorbitol transporter subunit IIC [Weizmannia sp. CD-2023]MEC2305505.1 PTS glucitol/sorbitol transporter subunit IIC [Weizmannia sp. CD-2023]MEC2341304.1 PTS glucitol/sorbitol transporter subunit IIC [Weizmannia sp. CD-2023]MED4841760.1 PTS glucitol/sorbitol transporter subunit IIC [Weizmannia sp. CD-2023]
MDILVHLAQGFMSLFQTGAKTFVSWMNNIVPVVLLLLVAMNTLIRLIGEHRINRLAKASSKNPLLRYLVLPFLASFMLGNPMALSMGRFLPEKYKPSYYASGAYFCHTSNGLFPHINPGELFIWMGIAQGIQKLGLNTADLAVRYFLVGLVMNFFAGWITDFTTKVVERQQKIKLKSEINLD